MHGKWARQRVSECVCERARERERGIPREENPKRLENRILTAFTNEETYDMTPGKAGSQGEGVTN